MLLRESGKKSGNDYELGVITAGTGNSGIAHEDLLRQLAETTVAGDWQKLANLRDVAEPILGAQGLVDVLAIIAGFYSITRIADSTGIPLDEPTRETTREMRSITHIDDFRYDLKSEKYRKRDQSTDR